ncbi:hypothetical protein [Oceanibacterium hippocampi]|uniref:Uncharacterized protein n=1 Tax=Oceanibacterium hippocampi TaxID=745714 RepID=A0A1Y5U300_9PROT|nr:hypothetical protein [Oceanibacterium hippocampi]SLN77315.1 hypothetical protein OCH7691_04383 [Oceanibacterium hippocampi]
MAGGFAGLDVTGLIDLAAALGYRGRAVAALIASAGAGISEGMQDGGNT